ncbi:hypothetical protein P7K49_006126 [Saguinus oedipus]|uniref:Uncharacterized protein n=1 Tax=Saguinus oedipus TaxID=9490 RepID=A0ABQ9W297_SAGOE|nr:hypothetical protein P7K49_006126 [Saguinus oedipus]
MEVPGMNLPELSKAACVQGFSTGGRNTVQSMTEQCTMRLTTSFFRLEFTKYAIIGVEATWEGRGETQCRRRLTRLGSEQGEFIQVQVGR